MGKVEWTGGAIEDCMNRCSAFSEVFERLQMQIFMFNALSSFPKKHIL